MGLSFHDHRPKSPKYFMEEVKTENYTYSAPMHVTVGFMSYEASEIKSQIVFMGNLPPMTPHGTFTTNGIERVVVSQFVCSPGMYSEKLLDYSSDKEIFGTKVIPSRST